MSGITTGIGLFSGIDSATIIQQLLSIEARPKSQAQARIAQLQLQQGAFLDLNSKFSALKSAAAAFRESKTFQTKQAVSSLPDVLKATAGVTAAPGSYTFLVDRLVSTQQMLSRGFADRDSAAIGATSFTFESTAARLDRDVVLADLNGGAGVERGKITITDSGGRVATIDLSRAVSVNEALETINGNGTAQITASVQGGRFIVKDNAGGSITIANTAGYNTATSMGIAGTATGTITGSNIYSLTATTSLASLNDGNGVSIKNAIGTSAFSFSINLAGATPASVQVNVGDVWEDVVPSGGGAAVLTKTKGAVTTVGGAITRINEALIAAGHTDVSATIDATNGRIVITDSSGTKPLTITENGATTAADLGIMTTPVSGNIQGRRILAGLNTSMARGLNGGQGLTGDGVLNFTARDGFAFSVTIDQTQSLTDIFAQIATASGTTVGGAPRISVTLDSKGTGILVTDNTGGGSNLIITGTTGQDTATSLGIATIATGVASSTEASGNLQRQYVSSASLVSTLNNGKGIGTGRFRITDAANISAEVDIGDDTKTLRDLIEEINSKGLKIIARINSTGDGVEIVEDLTTPAGAAKMKIEDLSGAVARNLNIAGTAADVGPLNKLNGSFERTVTFSAADNLQQVMEKINIAKVGVSAAIIRDGNGSTPFRLSFNSDRTGSAGRFIIDSGVLDLGLQTLDKGFDSKVFFGSSDPARAVAVTGSSNTVDGVLPGVRIDLLSASATPVNLTVSTDTGAIETAVNLFVTNFNALVDRIAAQTKYDDATKRRGPLLGDSTTLEMRSALYRTVQSAGIGTTGTFDQLADVGLSIGTGGKISLDADRFREALAQDPAGVEALFTARTLADDTVTDLGNGITVRNPNAGQTFSALGVVGQIEQLAERYLNSVSGILTGRNKGIDDQIKLQNERIAGMDSRLDRRRAQLERQFQAMERAIGQLQIQQGALGSISSNIRTG